MKLIWNYCYCCFVAPFLPSCVPTLAHLAKPAAAAAAAAAGLLLEQEASMERGDCVHF
jgi:hypothetical protein